MNNDLKKKHSHLYCVLCAYFEDVRNTDTGHCRILGIVLESSECELFRSRDKVPDDDQ